MHLYSNCDETVYDCEKVARDIGYFVHAFSHNVYLIKKYCPNDSKKRIMA